MTSDRKTLIPLGATIDIDLCDRVREFVAACCTVAPTLAMETRTIFPAFRAWMRRRGWTKAGGKKSFRRELRILMPSVRIIRQNNPPTWLYVGIGLARIYVENYMGPGPAGGLVFTVNGWVSLGKKEIL